MSVAGGGGAATLETDVPRFMMAMLIRAGLPSRRAAIVAVNEGNALFADSPGMGAWLESVEIDALTASNDWTTAGDSRALAAI